MHQHRRNGSGRGARLGDGGGANTMNRATAAAIAPAPVADVPASAPAFVARARTAAVGAYVVQDLRDAEGLTRALLRRAALRLALSRSEPARRLGGAYPRLDPPDSSELPKKAPVIETTGSSSAPRALPSGPGHAEPTLPDQASPR